MPLRASSSSSRSAASASPSRRDRARDYGIRRGRAHCRAITEKSPRKTSGQPPVSAATPPPPPVTRARTTTPDRPRPRLDEGRLQRFGPSLQQASASTAARPTAYQLSASTCSTPGRTSTPPSTMRAAIEREVAAVFRVYHDHAGAFALLRGLLLRHEVGRELQGRRRQRHLRGRGREHKRPRPTPRRRFGRASTSNRRRRSTASTTSTSLPRGSEGRVAVLTDDSDYQWRADGRRPVGPAVFRPILKGHMIRT